MSLPKTILACCSLLAFMPSHVAGAEPAFDSFTLANGTRVLVVPRPEETLVQAGWVMAVGSAQERPGETGHAQLVALLLDDGTRTIGTIDADRERKLLVEADGLRARRAWETDPTALDNRLAEIDRELATIQDVGAFRRRYEEAGLTPPRATVVEDATIFRTELPARELERFFRLEAERLRAPVFRRIRERIEEARAAWRADSELNLAAPAEQRFRLTAWDGHPYAWPPRGVAGDLGRITRRTLEVFREGHYAPDRLTVVLVGPVDPKTARTLAERHLGPLTPPAKRLPSRAAPALLPGERAFQEAVPTVPRLLVEYRVPGAGTPESDALELLAALLGGPEGRFQRALNAAAVNASARVEFTPRKELGSFRIEVAARVPGPDAPSFLAPVDQEIARLKNEPIPAEELARAREAIGREVTARLSDSRSLALALLADAGVGQPDRTLGLAGRLAKLTPEDLKRVATAALETGVRTVGVLQPAR